MSNKVLENMLVIALIGIIICFVFPIVENIIYKAQKEGIEASVYASIDSVKILYLNESSKKQINLPFSVVYNGDSYIAYVGGKEYSTDQKLETNGRKPISGKISISPNSYVTVTDLKYSKFICSMPPNGELNCTRNSK